MKNTIYSKFVNELCGKYVKKNSSVFDCGCGDGFHTSIIKNYADNVVGGDFDNRTKVEYGINFRKIGVNDYGSEGEFDVVTAFDVIEHVESDQDFVMALIKILKPGGILILGTPNRMRLSNFLISAWHGKIKYPRNLGYCYESGGDIIHLREYTVDDLNELVNKIGIVENVKIYQSFVGLYLPIVGPIGLKKIDASLLKKYCQHLFIVIRRKK